MDYERIALKVNVTGCRQTAHVVMAGAHLTHVTMCLQGKNTTPNSAS